MCLFECVRNGIMIADVNEPSACGKPTKLELIHAAIAKYLLEIESATTLKLTINLRAVAGRVDCKAIVEHYDKN